MEMYEKKKKIGGNRQQRRHIKDRNGYRQNKGGRKRETINRMNERKRTNQGWE